MLQRVAVCNWVLCTYTHTHYTWKDHYKYTHYTWKDQYKCTHYTWKDHYKHTHHTWKDHYIHTHYTWKDHYKASVCIYIHRSQLQFEISWSFVSGQMQSVLQCVTVSCSVLQCVAVYWSVLQCGAVRCSVSCANSMMSGATYDWGLNDRAVFCKQSTNFAGPFFKRDASIKSVERLDKFEKFSFEKAPHKNSALLDKSAFIQLIETLYRFDRTNDWVMSHTLTWVISHV